VIGASANLVLLIIGGDFNDSLGHPSKAGWTSAESRIAARLQK
jgi:hypothetical protein